MVVDIIMALSYSCVILASVTYRVHADDAGPKQCLDHTNPPKEVNKFSQVVLEAHLNH
jgi:hypothetical protein